MTLTEPELRGILEHMNQDHADTLRLYVAYYGGLHGVRRAELRELTRHEMRIQVEGPQVNCLMAIPLIRPIESARDARDVLVQMAHDARRGAGRNEPDPEDLAPGGESAGQ